jgi:hypothetical protein
MGEKQNQPFQLSFNSSLWVDFQGSRVTSDSGLLLVRELDERLGLSSLKNHRRERGSAGHAARTRGGVFAASQRRNRENQVEAP